VILVTDGIFRHGAAVPTKGNTAVWALDRNLTTVFASPSFAKLVGINRLVLSGVPWFVIVPQRSLTTLAWLVHTSAARPEGVLAIRHLDNGTMAVAASRVFGGPGWDKAVLTVLQSGDPLTGEHTPAERRRDGRPAPHRSPPTRRALSEAGTTAPATEAGPSPVVVKLPWVASEPCSLPVSSHPLQRTIEE